MMIVVDLARNIAVLLALALVYSLIARRWERDTWPGRMLAGLAFGAAAIIGMMTPVTLRPGLIFDGRSILLSIAGLFGGGVPAAIAALLAVAYRLALGGPGAAMGLGVIVTSAALGAGYHYWLRRRQAPAVRASHLLVLGYAVHVAMLLWTSALPADIRWETLQTIALPVLALYPAGEVLVGLLLIGQEARQRAEEALRESEARYRLHFENVSDVVYSIDPELRLLHVSPSVEGLLGYKPEELIGRHLPELNVLAPESLEQAFSDTMRVLGGEEIASSVYQFIARDGMKKWGEVSGAPLVRDGQVVALISVARDITERLQAEKALRRTKEYLENLIATANVMIVGLDAAGEISVFNRAAEELTGYSREELSGRSWFETLCPRERYPQVWAEFERLLAGGLPGEFENPILTRSGEERLIAWRNNQVVENGDVVGTLSFGLDITDRMRAVDALRRSEDLLRQVLDTNPAVIFVKDYDSRVLVANKTMAEFYNLSVAEVTGQLQFDLHRQHGADPKDIDQWLADDRQVIETGQPKHLIEVGTDSHRHLHWYETVKYPMDIGQDRRGVLVISADITERVRAEQVLHQRAAHLALLNDVGAQIAGSLDLDEVLERAAHLVQETFGYHHVGLFTLDRRRQELVMRSRAGEFTDLFPPGHRLEMGQGVVGWAARHGETLLANDVDAEPRYVNLYLDRVPTRAELSVPIRLREETLGVLDVQSPQANAFDEGDVQVLETLADQIAVAIENARLYRELEQELIKRSRAEATLRQFTVTLEEQVQQRTFELQVFHELAQEIGYARDYETLVQVFLNHLQRVLPYDLAAVILVPDDGWRLFWRNTKPLADGVLEAEQERLVRSYEEMMNATRPSEGVEVQVSEGKGSDPTQPPLSELATSVQVPISVGGQVIGLLAVASQQARDYGYDDLRILYALAAQMADSVQRLQALLAEERQRMESLVHNLPDGVVLLDAGNHILLANPAAQEALSILGDAAPGEQLTWLGSYPLAEVLRQASRSRPLAIAVEEPDARRFEVTVQPLSARSAAAGALLLVLRDVTEAHRVDEQLRRQERLAAVGQLAGGIAHDFNNILTSIVLYAQMFRRKDYPPERVEKGLQTIHREALRASELVRRILDFSRQSHIETRPLDLGGFVHEVLEVLKRTIPETVQIETDIGPVEYFVNADPTRLQQVLLNLVLNARDAMPQGGEVRIELGRFRLVSGQEPPVAEMPAGDWVHLSVADTGTGMTPEVMAHLFEPFFTTKPVGEGTGLGLAQVYGIVGQHQGHIGVESQVGRGTTFHIYLPAYGLPGREEVDVGKADVDLPQGSGEVILLVEDNDLVRDVALGILESLGYRVLAAAHGQEALEVYRQAERVDLVLTDMVMPQMGGAELIQALRKLEPKLKAVGATGYSLAEDVQTLKNQGIVEIVEKPFELEVLAEVVRRALDAA